MEKTTTLLKNRYTLAEEYVGIEDTIIPGKGVTIIYPAEDGYQKVKLGDGVTTLAELPWCGNESDLDAILEEAKAYTDSEIATFDFIKVVNELPEEGLPNKIYLVPKNDTQTQDLFDEWIYVNKGTEDAPEYVWEWITTKQVEVDLTPYATKEYVDTNKTQIVTTTGSGSAYIATVPGITSLTRGVSFVMIPHITSTAHYPTLYVNGLGAVGLRRQSSIVTSSAQMGYNSYWLAADCPITVMYNGAYWIVKDLVKPSASDLIGTVAVSNGGTGKSTLTSNAILSGNGTSSVKTITTASGALYATEENGAAQFGTLPIAQGGTGATTAVDALKNLGIYANTRNMDLHGSDFAAWQDLALQNIANMVPLDGSNVPYFFNLGWKNVAFGSAIAYSSNVETRTVLIFQTHDELGVMAYYWTATWASQKQGINGSGWKKLAFK